MTEQLTAFRERIDELDDAIVQLLSERFAVVRQVAAVKHAAGIPAVLPERIEAVKERVAAEGRPLGLDADFLRRLYQLVIDEACRVETELMRGC